MALSKDKITLDALVARIAKGVGCRLGKACDPVWLDQMILIAHEFDKGDSEPEEGYLKKLLLDFNTQVQMILPENVELPFVMVLDDSTRLVSEEKLKLNATQRSLLSFFDPTMKSVTLVEGGELYKNLYALEQISKSSDTSDRLNNLMDWLHFNRLRGHSEEVAKLINEYERAGLNGNLMFKKSIEQLKNLINKPFEKEDKPFVRPRGFDQLTELTLLIK